MPDLIVCIGLSIAEACFIPRPYHSLLKTLLALLLAQYVSLKCYRVFVYPFYVSPLRDVPGPKDNHVFFGQFIKRVRADGPATLYVKWMNEFPDAPMIRYLGFANNETLIVNSLNAHKEVLMNNFEAFPVSPWWKRTVRDVTGSALIDMHGEEHRAHKKMIMPCFSPRNLKQLEPIFQDKARNLCHVLERTTTAGHSGAVEGTAVIDVTEILTKTTLDVIGHAGLGIELSNLDYDSSGYEMPSQKVHQATSGNDSSTFYTSYDTILNQQDAIGQGLLAVNGFFPTRWIPCEANRKWRAAGNSLRRFLLGEIRQRRREVEEAKVAGAYGEKNSRDILTFMVEESVLPGGSAQGLDEQGMVGQLLQFMGAGHDTATITLTFSFYVMITQPSTQERLRAEILDLVNRTPGGEPSFSAIDELQYLNMFVKEVLRVYPPLVAVQRQAGRDVVVEGVAIPKGTPIDVVTQLISQNPLIWGPRAGEVDPDRWLNLEGDQRSPYAFGAFSNGPKICIGRAFALAEIKTILFETLQRFRLLSVEKPFVLESPSLSLRPIGLEIRIKKIAS